MKHDINRFIFNRYGTYLWPALALFFRSVINETNMSESEEHINKAQ